MHLGAEAAVRRYLARHPWGGGAPDELPAPDPRLKLCVVIPSLAEAENLPAVLRSLGASRRPAEAEVLVLVNQSETAPPEILKNNQATMQLQAVFAGNPLPIYFLDRFSSGRALPAADAGVGLARRLGLDAGLARLQRAGNLTRASLACLDADSPVGPGYLDAVLEVFDRGDQPAAGYCTYAHPVPADPALRLAGAAYELWLRYVAAGLRVAGSWFAFPTIGSCTVVSAAAYARVGGMEPRQAAEDFHFLRKLAKLSGEAPLAFISRARVFPAARVSARVPFGTGRAMQRSLDEGPEAYLWVEPPEVFFDLAEFFRRLPEGYDDLDALRRLPPRLLAFLEAEGAWPVLGQFRKIYPGARQFTQAGQHWFDSLRCVRYANEVTRTQGRVWAFAAWAQILRALAPAESWADLKSPEPGQAGVEESWAWLSRVRSLVL
jgi:hypothetical protein